MHTSSAGPNTSSPARTHACWLDQHEHTTLPSRSHASPIDPHLRLTRPCDAVAATCPCRRTPAKSGAAARCRNSGSAFPVVSPPPRRSPAPPYVAPRNPSRGLAWARRCGHGGRRSRLSHLRILRRDALSSLTSSPSSTTPTPMTSSRSPCRSPPCVDGDVVIVMRLLPPRAGHGSHTIA
jgi:hypothetical protein